METTPPARLHIYVNSINPIGIFRRMPIKINEFKILYKIEIDLGCFLFRRLTGKAITAVPSSSLYPEYDSAIQDRC